MASRPLTNNPLASLYALNCEITNKIHELELLQIRQAVLAAPIRKLPAEILAMIFSDPLFRHSFSKAKDMTNIRLVEFYSRGYTTIMVKLRNSFHMG